MLAIFYAIISYIGWGSGDTFGAIATRRMGAYSETFWSLCLGLLISLIYAPYAIDNLKKITPEVLFINLILGVILIIGLVAYNKAIMVANPSLVTAIATSFTSVVVLLSILFFRESISLSQTVAILLIIAGVLIASISLKNISRGELFSKGTLLAIVAMVTWGIYFTFIRIPIEQIGWFWPNIITFLLFPLLLVPMKIQKIPLRFITYNKALVPLVIGIILVRVAEFSFNFAITQGSSSIIAPIAGSNITLFLILSYFVFKEPLTTQQIMGVASSVLGIILLAFFHS